MRHPEDGPHFSEAGRPTGGQGIYESLRPNMLREPP